MDTACSANGQRQIITIIKYRSCGKRNQGRHIQKTSQLLKGPEQARRPQPCKLCDDNKSFMQLMYVVTYGITLLKIDA
jgi:hypothetical protein